MVKGLEIFRNHFANFSGSYVLIGGTACDLAFATVNQEFRATNDLDIVLVSEGMTRQFAEAFWARTPTSYAAVEFRRILPHWEYPYSSRGFGRRLFSRSVRIAFLQK